MVAVNNLASSAMMQVVSLHRYAVKGLSCDNMETVIIDKSFPFDRQYALIKSNKRSLLKDKEPEWLHKENFLCAFTANALLANFDAHFKDDEAELTLWKRIYDDKHVFMPSDTRAAEPLLSAKLGTVSGRAKVSDFFSNACGEGVELVTVGKDFQFGNTRSGVKARGNTRTCHIVNAATVRQVSEKLGVQLDPLRFRPNIIVDGLEPWAEFDAVGKHLVSSESDVLFDVVSRTVRCDGISVDPLDPKTILDLPSLLNQHFPEHGPYLGVYAVVDQPGILSTGDTFNIKC
uniref:MOSC domain-containing protein n=1 Tax=Leptocylindrus danicus TaxID=163516 RepID=A0A7S2LHB7_9STRA|mmetsp:Transcript_5577/g.8188  ORF Transcript_5577/g.8188 Transcript_5577/m.8188 type:complete len:289 (+) Transcript_5577:283-1149(+)